MFGKSGFFASSVSCSTAAGATTGALAGLGIGIWICVEYIQPAFASVPAISSEAASAITAAIALCGFLEATVGIGACAGMSLCGCCGAAVGLCGCAALDESESMALPSV